MDRLGRGAGGEGLQKSPFVNVLPISLLGSLFCDRLSFACRLSIGEAKITVAGEVVEEVIHSGF